MQAGPVTETDKPNIETIDSKQLSLGKLILQYTVIFAVIAAGVFAVFIIYGKSFLHYGDPFKQGYFWLAELKDNLGDLAHGKMLPQWTWSRGLGLQFIYRLDFFNFFASFFPVKIFELGYSIALLLKLYCGGLAYLIYARDLKMDNFRIIAGATFYSFTTWFISVTIVQGTFMFICMLLPLLLMSIDWIYRGKSPVLFIAVVAYFLIRDAYLAYMAAIAAIIYMVFRYFAYNDKFNAKEYFTWIGKFVVYGFTAALVSGAFMLQFVMATMRASMSSPNDTMSILCKPSFYYGFGRTLMDAGYTTGYTYIGVPIMAILVLPFVFKRLSLKNTHVLMLVIFLGMAMFPFFSHMFNGFGYSTGRWYFLIVLFMNLSTMQCLDIEKLGSRKNIIIMCVWLAILAVWTLGFDALDLIGLNKRETAYILAGLATGAGLIFIIGAFKNSKITIKTRQIGVLALTAVMLVTCWSLSFYLNKDKYIPIGETYDRLCQSTQRVSGSIDDDGFYRTDQVSWINLHHDIQMPANENLYWGAKTIYGYDSFISSNQIEFNRLTGNTHSYVMRVYTLGNDNRMGLDFLYGVKYFLGNDAKKGDTTSDNYAGYGFTKVNEIDGVNILENKYDPGLGFGYDKYMKESEFGKLNRLAREQSLLQAVVVPDDEVGQLPKGMKELKAGEADIDIADVPYEIVETNGLTIEGNRIVVTENMGSMTIKVSPVTKSQLMVSFDNLYRTDGKSLNVYCDNEFVEEQARTAHSNQSIADVRDFDINMGYYDEYEGTMTISFATAAEYTFDKLYLSAMSAENYDKYAQERMAEKYDISEYDDHNVKGTVDMKSDGVVYFSIPQFTHWEVYVDGEKQEKVENVNVAFLGVAVPEGTHDIQLKYNNKSMTLGVIMTIVGLIIMTLIAIYFRRKNKGLGVNKTGE